MLRPTVPSCAVCALGATGSCRFKPRTVAAGTQLWLQGAERPPLLFVKDGVLSVSTTDGSGRELAAGVRGPQSMLGLESVRGEPARAAVATLTRATVCSLPPGTLGYPEPREAATLLDFALDELAETARDAELRAGPALSRVARFFLRSAELLAPGRRAPFSKRHVAALLDVRPETMSRCLRTLEEAKVISTGRAVRVLDPARLEAIARGEGEAM